GVGAEADGLGRELFQVLVSAAQQYRAHGAAQGVGELARFAQQLPGHAVHMAAVVFDEHPDALVGLELFRQFEVAAAAGGTLGGCSRGGGGVHASSFIKRSASSVGWRVNTFCSRFSEMSRRFE